jgi:nucleoside-diphosphate-sugar epimerase
MSAVLVTGGSGFVAGHCILQLLAAGYQVRTTVRSLQREPDVRAVLRQGGAEPGDRLTFVAADLGADIGWHDAVTDCQFVLHVASPFPMQAPAHEDDLIVPAREGTLRVLRAARAAGVKRVVLTSSFAAVGYGHEPQAAPFNETDWTDLNGAVVAAYVKSKTLAERAAWDFISIDGKGMELSVVNPVAIFGPVLGPHLAASVRIVQRMLEGGIPACPRLYFGIIDVRDVAELHLRAMTHPAAAGERFLAVAGPSLSMLEMAQILRRRLGALAHKVPSREFPDWLLRGAALFSPTVRQVVPEVGKIKNATSEKARRVLGWSPRSSEESIVATGESLAQLGLLKSSARPGT